ncbi:uncharacterized protein LOC124612444 isoform X1 [Schistocerca americana]|uniref:uncharacterized protein LOC124612444 isoform X1 n=2 Tax=Schistocerca americana TaxID=7009 RepID=UPI001F4F954C|nr:uncharacterized protein LOC124612444 isoform X1 [Schistocerca americana]
MSIFATEVTVEKETRKVKQDTELLSMKIKELKNCQNDLLNEISQKKCELEMLQQKESLLKEMCSEKEKNLQKEESSLDEMQRAVWEHREKFCEKVKEFSKRSWLSALSNIHSASQSLIVKTYLQSLTVNATEEKFCVICHATEH